MWLINTETLRLECVLNPETVEYAILSHTWEEEEVSFQEFQDLKLARTRRGFAKIEMTCSIAKNHGYRYAWVDTCCIDKSSSAELSEAINSMFRWYKGAECCYVYLSDFKKTTVDDTFRRCRWFTRGWTLQELIAPSILTFYNRHWNPLGSKTELCQVISKITRIEQKVLLGQCDISTVAVLYRMSWAAGRKTSRPEDIAYCLFGIFDINLPMLYGEGTKAFLRLQEEICQRIDDWSLFAWKTDTDEAGRGRGIFANSPDEFAHASTGKYLRAYSIGDVRVSNRGIIFDDVELTIIKGQGLVLPLNLLSPTQSFSYVQGGIFLEKNRYGYVRIKTDQLFPPRSESRVLAPEQINVISWGTLPVGNHLFSICVSTSNDITIRNVSPRRRWDPYRDAFLDTQTAMVELVVNLGTGQALSLLALLSLSFRRLLMHDIVDSGWERWSDALANMGRPDASLSWVGELRRHFHKPPNMNLGKGTWMHPTRDGLFDIQVQVEKVEQNWQVRLSIKHPNE